MRKLLLVLLLAGLLAPGCGRRWLENAPFRINVRPDSFNLLLQRARKMGYRVLRRDAKRGTFTVQARLDAREVQSFSANGGFAMERASFFHVRLHRDGTVTITASGYHVRERGARIHHKLHRELADFAGGLQYGP